MKIDVMLFKIILSAFFVFEISDVNCNQGYSWPFNDWDKPQRDVWEGSWFPHSPQQEDHNTVTDYGQKDSLYDPEHGIRMGIIDDSCDNGKVNLNVDWNESPINYTCFEDKSEYYPQSSIHPIHTTEFIPHAYVSPHKCMDESIDYEQIIPTFGTHRPLWAKYGEYTFVPKQRWLHNLEHGAVVMLYHPCANKNEVRLLKKLVKMCLYRHIITPNNQLSMERPLALVSWGHLLEMSKVSPTVVIEFIRDHALRGPEKTPRDGQYDFMLTEHAKLASDIDDSNLCPFIN